MNEATDTAETHGGSRPRVGLVLPGGFLRCAFQVGAIEALDACGIRFDLIVGVSAGAWNAACVAAGQIRQMRHWWMDVAAAPKLSFRNFLRNGTLLNFRTIVDLIPARGICFDRLVCSPVRLFIGVTRIRSWTFHLFDNAERGHDFLRILLASSYIPGIYGPPVKINGCYYADGGFTDNVPYEAALQAGCERVYVVASDPAGILRKRHFGPPLQINPALRERMTIIHPPRPLLAWRLAATPQAISDSIEVGRHAALEALRADGMIINTTPHME